MKRKLLFMPVFLPVFVAVILAGCNHKGPGEADNLNVQLEEGLFEAPISLGLLANNDIDEASGLVASRSNAKAYWTHNDSGGESRIFLISNEGKHLGVLTLKGIEARDWEDITLGPGPKEGINYLYVGDIGDNKAQYDEKRIYRFPEPNMGKDQSPVNQTVDKEKIETIRYKYPDGKRDAETIMVDPITKDIIIVTKREKEGVRMYVARYPQSTQEVITLEKVSTLNLHKIVAGDISPNGKEVLLKDYGNVYYWKKSGNESILKLLTTPPKRLPYVAEPQGESIAWKLDGSGYFTLSEERHKVEAELYFYKRK